MTVLVNIVILILAWASVECNYKRDKLFFLEKSSTERNETILVVTWMEERSAGCEIFTDKELIDEVLMYSDDFHIRTLSENKMTDLLGDCTEFTLRKRRRRRESDDTTSASLFIGDTDDDSKALRRNDNRQGNNRQGPQERSRGNNEARRTPQDGGRRNTEPPRNPKDRRGNGEAPRTPQGGRRGNGETPNTSEGGRRRNGDAPGTPQGGRRGNGETPNTPEGGRRRNGEGPRTPQEGRRRNGDTPRTPQERRRENGGTTSTEGGRRKNDEATKAPQEDSQASRTTTTSNINAIDTTVDATTTEPPSTMGYDGLPVIFPGTKWCGAGAIAKDYDDLGKHDDTDKCCRAHDLCNDTLAPGETRHNLTNKSSFTTLSCQCDDDFYDCLATVNSFTSNTVGNMYFNLLKRQCYKKEYPLTKTCSKYLTLLKITCMEYERDTQSPKEYQMISAKRYRKIALPKPLSITLPF